MQLLLKLQTLSFKIFSNIFIIILKLFNLQSIKNIIKKYQDIKTKKSTKEVNKVV